MATKDTAKTKTTEEPKATLPVGHPQAGYVSPDLSGSDGAGTLPPEEVEAHEERDALREEEVEAVAANEDKVAKEEQAKQEEQAKIGQERAEYLEKEKYGPTAGKLPGDTSYKPESAGTSKSSS